MDSFCPKSISTRFILFLTCIMTLVFFIFFLIITEKNTSSANSKILQRLTELTTIAESSLTVALWQYNYQHINDFVDTIFLYEDIIFIGVKTDNTLIKRRVKSKYAGHTFAVFKDKEQFATTSIALEYNNTQVGEVSFVVDPKPLTQFITSNTIHAIIGLFFIIITASIAAFIFIRHFIIKPIQHLENSTVAIAQGNLDGTIKIDTDDELGILAKNLDEMRIAIRDSIEKIRHTDELKEANLLLQKEISERQQAQLSLKNSEERFRYVLNHSVDTIYNFNLVTETYDYISPSCLKTSGYTQDEFLNLGLRGTMELFHPDDAQKLKDHFKNLLENSSGNNFSLAIEYRFHHKELGYRWIHDTRSIVFDSQHNPLSIVGSARDVTERKLIEIEKSRLEEQLFHSQKMEAIGTMAGGIAHDFNNILSAILGYADMAQDDCKPGSSLYEDLDEILLAGNRAKHLVQQILAFSRKEILKHSVINLEPVIKEALKLIRATTPTSIEIRQHIDPHCGCIMADPTKIHQVLMNLCMNGAQALEEQGGIIEVRLSSVTLKEDDLRDGEDFSPGPYIMLSVTDNGPGIAESISHRIFDPYFTTKPIGKGSGMGLSVVIGIVNSSNGLMKVTSHPDTETTFQIFFPEIREEGENKITETEPLATGSERILIVDDEISIVNLTRRRVENLGYQATATTSSKKALQIFHKQPQLYDLVITDQTMPEMTGDILTQDLRKIRADIPIIVCSGYNEKMDSEKAASLGINTFLMKPVDKKDLAVAIRNTLGGETS